MKAERDSWEKIDGQIVIFTTAERLELYNPLFEVSLVPRRRERLIFMVIAVVGMILRL